jgi:hypothetical protein
METKANNTMNRRHLMKLSLLAALASAGQVEGAPKPRKGKDGSVKKGLGIGGTSPDFDRKLKELNCKWFYNWTGAKPDNSPSDIPFIPMVWKYSGNPQAIEKIAAVARKENSKELLAFNEPDRSSQSNMSVVQALEAWPLLQQTGLRLGSPACVHPDSDWMEEFMAGVKERNLKVDFICVHSYAGPNADAFIDRLKTIHKLYDRPLWITEFAVGDWNAKSLAENRYKPDDILKFMKEVLPKLDRLDFLERYAWFPADADNRTLGNSALWDTEGKLTPLGELYRDS